MKLITLLLLIIIIISGFTTLSFAVGPATVYKVKIKKLELWNGSEWVTAFDGTSSTLDIASVSSGQSAGVFLSGLSVPDGVYTKVRVTPHPNFGLKGNDGTRYTLGVTGTNGGCTYTNTAALAAECTVTLVPPFEPTAQEQDFSATPITVTNGVPDKKVRVSFDVSGAVQYNAGADELFPAPPTVTITVMPAQ